MALVTLVNLRGASERVRANVAPTLIELSALLLGMSTFVNVAVLVPRRDRVEHDHFRISRIVPWLGTAACLFLVTPLIGRDVIQYQVAGWPLRLGVVMWGVTYLARSRKEKMRLNPAALK